MAPLFIAIIVGAVTALIITGPKLAQMAAQAKRRREKEKKRSGRGRAR